MTLGMTQVGASVRGLALAMADPRRPHLTADPVQLAQAVAAAAADRLPAADLRALQPVARPADAAAARREVLAERGVDQAALAGLGPRERIAAEMSLAAATAERLRQAAPLDPAVGRRLDLRV